MSIVFLEKDESVNKPVFYMSNEFRLFPIICMSLKRLNLLCLTKKDILVTFSYFRQFLANLKSRLYLYFTFTDRYKIIPLKVFFITEPIM